MNITVRNGNTQDYEAVEAIMQQDFRGKGIGSLLLEQMKKKVVSENLDGLELQVNARNQAAREFYENLGFTEKSINMELILG